METPPRTPRPLVLPAFAPLPELDPVAYDRLAHDVLCLLGIDLAQYKPAQVWRRVNGFATARGVAGPDALIARAREDPKLRQAFLDMLTINVSEFFRNPEAWNAFVERYLAPLLRNQSTVRIWSAGCSLGFEPISLAILIDELSPARRIYLLATDLDETILSRARAGRYTQAQMAGVSEARRERYFRQVEDKWEVRPEILNAVTYRRHDLLKDPYERPFDIIVCRNVVIYFTEVAKLELYRRFSEALRRGGVLFMGATESISNAPAVGLMSAGMTFYTLPVGL
jgi:chemotaxis protein methyltransferase CheR